MGKTDNFYTEEEVLLEMPKGRDKMRVLIGHKKVRGEAKLYLDVRTWYQDDAEEWLPGKGFAKPMTKEEMTQVGKAILDYAGRE